MGSDTPLISIIATFYNLEDYVDRCVTSLINQQYANIEIILVDDGSSDNTWQLLKEYESIPNVKLIRQKNAGPGAARNTGMNASNGDWIYFVDGDDYLYPWSIKLLSEKTVGTDAQIVIGLSKIVVDDVDNQHEPSRESTRVHALTQKEAIQRLLLEADITEAPWTKLIKRNIATSNPFPENTYYEDVAWAPKILLSCSNIILVEAIIYAYWMRQGSVVHRKEAHIQQARDFSRAIEQMFTPIEHDYPDMKQEIAYRRALELSRLHALLKTIPNNKEAASMDASCLEEISNSYTLCKSLDSIPKAKKMRIGLMAHAPFIHDRVLGFYERYIKGR